MNTIIILFALLIILFFSFYNTHIYSSHEPMDTMKELLKKIKRQKRRKKKLKKKGKKGKSKKKAKSLKALRAIYDERLQEFKSTRNRIEEKLKSIEYLVESMEKNKDNQHKSIQNTRQLITQYIEQMHRYELLS